jgi:Arc/MetJ family transcription regulator
MISALAESDISRAGWRLDVVTMARTVIDVDDQMLAQAAEIFGTKTKVATVNAALEDAIKRRKRQAFLDRLADGGLPDLTGPIEPATTETHSAETRSAEGAA